MIKNPIFTLNVNIGFLLFEIIPERLNKQFH